MITLYAITVLALLAGAESFKLSLKPPSQDEARLVQHSVELHPAAPVPAPVYREQTREPELTGLKGGQHLQQERFVPLTRPFMAPLAPPPQQHSLAYVIIRPILTQPQYQYLEPLRQYPAPPRPYLAPLQPPRAATKGSEFRYEQQAEQLEHQAPVKGAPEEPALPANQLHYEEQQTEVQGQPLLAPVIAKSQGKLMKLKSSFDKLAATAKSKLTLGSTYQVISEELVAPQAPVVPLPLEQQQIQQQEDISLTAQEQENLRERPEQQQQLKTDFPSKSLAPQREQQQQLVVQQDKAPYKPQLDESFGELKREHQNNYESRVQKN